MISALVVYGVPFEVEQWGLLVVVFVLTMSALYGLGMMLASLFLLWGREAFHMTNVLIEPVYFVSGSTSRSAGSGRSARSRSRRSRSPSASTPCASWCSPAQPYITGTPSPEVEALILVAMTVVFTLRRALDDPRDRADGPRARQPLDPLAVSAPDRGEPGAGLGSPGRGFDPARTEGGGAATRGATCGPRAPRLAGGVQLDRPRSCSSSTRSPSRSRRCCSWS